MGVGGWSGSLVLWATWAPPDEDMDALRHEIAAGLGEPDERRVILSFAPISNPVCRALIGDGHGAFETAATSATSGIAPFDAVLGLSLDTDRLVRARAGLGGAPGFLAIEYAAELGWPTRARATFRAVSPALLPWIQAQYAGGRPVRDLLDEALASGLATVTLDPPEPPAGPASSELVTSLLDEVARSLPRWEAQGAAFLEATAQADQAARTPIRAFADVASLLPAQPGLAAPGGPHASD